VCVGETVILVIWTCEKDGASVLSTLFVFAFFFFTVVQKRDSLGSYFTSKSKEKNKKLLYFE